MFDKYTNFIKFIKEQSLYYNMTFTFICFLFLVAPVIINKKYLSKLPGLLSFREKFLPYICILFIILFVISGGQFLTKIVCLVKRKKYYRLSNMEKNVLYIFAENSKKTLYGTEIERKLKFNKIELSLIFTGLINKDFISIQQDVRFDNEYYNPMNQYSLTANGCKWAIKHKSR